MKKNQSFFYKSARAFRFNSVFIKTFLIVLFFSTVLLGAFCFYTLRLENQNLQKKTEASYLSMMETKSISTEVTLQSFQELMRQTMGRREFTNAVIVPRKDSYTRTLNIIPQLRKIVDNYPLVIQAFLYIPTNNMVYSSNLSYLSAEQSKDPLFQNLSLLMEYSGARLTDSAEALFIKKIDNRLILCQHFYPDYLNSIGALIFEIDLSLLDFSLSGEADALSDTLYVFDQKGNSVFSQEVTETAASQAAVLRARAPLEKSGILKDSNGMYCFYYESPMTNWLYLYPAEASLFHFQSSYGRVFSFGCIVIGLGFLFSLQIAFRANQPVRSLLKEIAKTNPDSIDAKNEVDYLTKVYNYTAVQNQHLHQSIQSITPLVLERMFSDLLSGRFPADDSIKATLDSIGQPFKAHSRFMVLTLAISNKISGEISIVEMNLHILQIRNLLYHMIPAEYLSCLVPTENQQLAIVIACPPQAADSQVQQMVFLLCKQLQSLEHKASYQIESGYGTIYNQISDVRYSYLEAWKNLNHKRFYGDNSALYPLEGISRHNRYFDKTNQIFSHIQADEREKAVLLANLIIDEIGKERLDMAAAKQEYELFADTILTLTDALHIGNTEELLFLKAQLLNFFNHCTISEELEDRIRAFCGNAIAIIENRNRKKTHQHIIRIKEYIHANYSDSSLSLYMAAEHAGISSSYLSRLFKKEMGASFVDYTNNYRVEKSKFLLESSELLIKEIAYQTGFNSMQNFFRIFKKHNGCSPGEYRQSYNRAQESG